MVFKLAGWLELSQTISQPVDSSFACVEQTPILVMMAALRAAALNLKRQRPDERTAATAPSSPPVVKTSGIKNLGNSCYMSCVLQALFHCEQLRRFFLTGCPPALPHGAGEVASKAHGILDALVRSTWSHLSAQLNFFRVVTCAGEVCRPINGTCDCKLGSLF